MHFEKDDNQRNHRVSRDGERNSKIREHRRRRRRATEITSIFGL